MTLADVATGQPHVAAHNDERHAINSLQDAVDAIGVGGVSSVASRTGDVVITTTDLADFNTASDARVALVVAAAPSQLNTLKELADALGDDANYAATITAALAAKAPLASPAFTGTPTGIIAPGTHAATSKTPPVDADEIPIADSAASFGLKKLTWANLKATLLVYFRTYFAPADVRWDGTGTQPNRPITNAGQLVKYFSPIEPTGGGTVGGGGNAVTDLDIWFVTTS